MRALIDTTVKYKRPEAGCMVSRVGIVLAAKTDGDLIIQDCGDRQLSITRPSAVEMLKDYYAFLGFDPGTKKFVVGDTKDNENYARNSFHKHFPNCIEVEMLSHKDN